MTIAIIFSLQWGRTFSSAENAGFSECLPGLEYLQWGRTFSSAEKVSIAPRFLVGNGQPSMGPHFFKCGKIPYSRLSRRHPLPFNGAALFQVRKKDVQRQI